MQPPHTTLTNTRTFIVIPPVQNDPVLAWRNRWTRGVKPDSWATLVRYFAVLGYTLPIDDPGPGSVIGFRRSGDAVVLTSSAVTAGAYAAAIARGLAAAPSASGPGRPAQQPLVERLAAEIAALRRLIDEKPELTSNKHLLTAVTHRIVVVDEVSNEITRRIAAIASSHVGKDSADTKAIPDEAEREDAESRRALMRDMGNDNWEVDEHVIQILTRAWLRSLGRGAPPDDGDALLGDKRRASVHAGPSRYQRVARQLVGGVLRGRGAHVASRTERQGRRRRPRL